MGSHSAQSWSSVRGSTSAAYASRVSTADQMLAGHCMTSSLTSSSYTGRQYLRSPELSPKHSPLREIKLDDNRRRYDGSRSPEFYVSESKKSKLDYSPQFTVTLRPRVVEEGATARFSCSVTGIPTPDVTWYRGPVKLDNTGRFISLNNHGLLTLEVVAVSRDDASLYTCKAVNEHGTASCCASLEIQETEYEEDNSRYKKPRIIQSVSPETITANHGDRVTLVAQVSGYPVPSIKWMKDGSDLKESFRFRMRSDDDGQAELCILNARADDSGLYHCIASNTFGSCSTYATVTVSKELQSSSDAEPEVPHKDFTFVNQMALSDDGNSPWFLKQLPGSVSLKEGEPLVLECIVSGDPPPVVTWKKGGRTLRYDRRHRVMVEGNRHILEIPETLATDYGEYTAIAHSALGSHTSKATFVDIRPKSGKLERFVMTEETESRVETKSDLHAPHFVTDLPEKIEAIKDEKLRLHCNTNGSPDVQSYKYEKKSVTSYQEKSRQTHTDADGGLGAPVFIKSLLADVVAEVGSSAEFRCNYDGSAEQEQQSSPGNDFAPMFITPLRSMVAKPGDSILIKCRASEAL